MSRPRFPRFNLRRWARAVAVLAAVNGAFLSGRAAPVIAEMMANNNSGITDQNNFYAGWVELYNPEASSAVLTGYYLTNSATVPTRWKFPAVTLAAGARLVVFCSGKNYIDPAQKLATNFTLPNSGGYVALVAPDGSTVVSSITYPAQNPDISYGITQPTAAGEQQQVGYLIPTPGQPNGNYTNLLLADQVAFSVAAGIFTGTKTINLSGGSGSEHIRYQVIPPTKDFGAAVPAPTAAWQLYTGPFAISSTQLLAAAVFSADDSQRGLVNSSLYLQLDNSTPNRVDTFTSALPLVVYDDNGFGLLPNNHLFYPAWFGVYSVSATKGVSSLTQAADIFTPDLMKLHGFSSATWPKQSYEVNMTTSLGASASRSVLTMLADKSWDNISVWSIDLTYIHNSFVYSLARGMGYWAPSTRFAEMFIHNAGGILDAGSYAGLTNVSERIKVAANRVNIYSLATTDVTAPNVTGGYILKFDHPEDADRYHTFTTTHGQTLMIENPGITSLVKAQSDYITGYVQQMENAMVADQAGGYITHNYLNYLDRGSWVDYHLLNVLTKNDDAFIFSEYFTKDINGLIKAGPVWDYDRALGGADSRDIEPTGWNPANVGDYWNISWWTYLTHDPDFMQTWVDRWQSLRLSLFSTNNLLSLIDSFAAQIGPAAAIRDSTRWPANQSRYAGGWPGEISHMKAWVSSRAQWIDAQFVAPPVMTTNTGGVILTPAPGTRIIYTLDGSDPRLSRGGIAGSALTSTTAVTLAATQSFSARSYDNAMNGVYPGSPWSSPVTVIASAPTVSGKIADVSCRTLVGTGANILIGGLYISGPAGVAKQVLVRGVGPGLAAYGVTGVLAEPTLAVYDSAGKLVATNTGWTNNANATVLRAVTAGVGTFALGEGSADCSMLVSLTPGAYTVHVSGVAQSTGAALLEVYEVSQTSSSIVDISSRSLVNSASGPVITGFVIVNGTAQVLLRGDGPSLSQYGITAPLAQPVLQVFDSSGKLMASNAGWSNNANAAQIAAAAAAVGAFPLPANSADSALLLTLPPGGYTMQISGAASSTGDTLAECYLVPNSPK